jgi:cathepsin F
MRPPPLLLLSLLAFGLSGAGGAAAVSDAGTGIEHAVSDAGTGIEHADFSLGTALQTALAAHARACLGARGERAAARYAAFAARFGRRAALCARVAAFAANERAAAELSAADPGAEYSAEHSPFGDLTADEFARSVLMQGGTGLRAGEHPAGRAAASAPAAPAALDWTERPGVVGPVRDQGSLGTCYAFSAAGAVEGQLALRLGLGGAQLSVEHSLECNARAEPATNNAVCGVFGGWPYLVLGFWESSPPQRETAWPYCAGTLDATSMPLCFPCMPDGYYKRSCGPHGDLYCNATMTLGQGVQGRCADRAWLAANRAATVTGWRRFSANETELAAQLAAHGPLSATIDARLLQLYRRGVANPHLCRKDILNHCRRRSARPRPGPERWCV